jgi:hypothetical protein
VAQIIPVRPAREARHVGQLFAPDRRFHAGSGAMRVISVGLALSILLAGCATILRGTEQDVTVDTVPRGAMVAFSDGQSCTSPCSIAAKRSQSLQVNIWMEGCTPQTAFIRPRMTAIGGVLGGLPDLATGAVYDLEPSSLSFALQCANSG